jgi:hypothetical protein
MEICGFRKPERLGESLASMTRISNPVADRLRNEAGAVEKDLQKLETFAEIAWKSGQWDELTSQVNVMDGEVVPGCFIR